MQVVRRDPLDLKPPTAIYTFLLYNLQNLGPIFTGLGTIAGHTHKEEFRIPYPLPTRYEQYGITDVNTGGNYPRQRNSALEYKANEATALPTKQNFQHSLLHLNTSRLAAIISNLMQNYRPKAYGAGIYHQGRDAFEGLFRQLVIVYNSSAEAVSELFKKLRSVHQRQITEDKGPNQGYDPLKSKVLRFPTYAERTAKSSEQVYKVSTQGNSQDNE